MDERGLCPTHNSKPKTKRKRQEFSLSELANGCTQETSELKKSKKSKGPYPNYPLNCVGLVLKTKTTEWEGFGPRLPKVKQL